MLELGGLLLEELFVEVLGFVVGKLGSLMSWGFTALWQAMQTKDKIGAMGGIPLHQPLFGGKLGA